MVNLREAQDILLHCHADNLINDEEFILLYDVTKPWQSDREIFPETEILGWCPVGPVLPRGEKVPL